MLSFFRRVSKSKIGTGIMAAILVAILAGFALADLSNFGTGNLGFGMSSGTLAKVGDQQVSEREVNDAVQRRLQDVRQQQPNADYRSIMGDFSTIIDATMTFCSDVQKPCPVRKMLFQKLTGTSTVRKPATR